MRLNTIIKGNTFEIDLSEYMGQIDLIYTDPPYLISHKNRIYRDYRSGKHGNISYDFGKWDYSFDIKDFMGLSYDMLNDNGQLVIWTSEQLYGEYRRAATELGMQVKQMLVWVKNNPTPQFRLMAYRQATELMIWITKRKLSRKNPNFIFGTQRDMTNVFYAPIVGGKERLDHPTQKPLGICRDIIKTHCRPAGIVFDPFTGSGTIPTAAVMEGRRYIGVESDEAYFEMASGRVSAVYDKIKRTGNILSY